MTGVGIKFSALVLEISRGILPITILLDDAITYSVQMTASNDYGTSPRSNGIVIQAAAPLCDPALCDDGYVDTVDDQCVQGIFVAEGVKVVRRLLESRFEVVSVLLPEKT